MTGRRVYVACASSGTSGERDGIAMFERDAVSGELDPTPVHAPLTDATFVALHPSGQWLYATCKVEERGGGTDGGEHGGVAGGGGGGGGAAAGGAVAGGDGGVAAFRIGHDGELAAIGTAPTGGTGTCHVAVHPSGRYLFSADYASGHVAVHRIGGDGTIGERCELVVSDGKGPDPERQTHSHAHCCWPDPEGRFVLAVDLGTDEVRTYALDATTGKLAEVAVGAAEAASGPRHLVAHRDGYLLVTGELDSSLMTFSYDPESGATHQLARTPATGRVTRRGESSPSELAVDGSGRFCYVANRGADSIGVFALGAGPPRMVAEVSCEGHWPRHLAVIAEHLYVANQKSASVAVFALDAATGLPRATGMTEVQHPHCVLAAP